MRIFGLIFRPLNKEIAAKTPHFCTKLGLFEILEESYWLTHATTSTTRYSRSDLLTQLVPSLEMTYTFQNPEKGGAYLQS